MQLKKGFSIAAFMVFSLALGTPAVAAKDLPEVTEEGLHLVKDSSLATVYAKPDVDLGVYDRVWLVDATVAFKKNWMRDQNRTQPFKVRPADMERIKAELADLFREVFTEKLTAGGYELVGEADEDVLIVRPAIVNLDVRAPDVQTTTRSYQLSETAGEMTLYVELYDAVTGDILAKAIDRKQDRGRGSFQWQTSVSNRLAAKSVLNLWADTLVDALDAAHVSAGQSGEDH